MQAVDAAAVAEEQQRPNANARFKALRTLLDHISHPMLILIGERLSWTTLLSQSHFAA